MIRVVPREYKLKNGEHLLVSNIYGIPGPAIYVECEGRGVVINQVWVQKPLSLICSAKDFLAELILVIRVRSRVLGSWEMTMTTKEFVNYES